MRKLFIVCLLAAVAILNVKALLHEKKQSREQEPSTMAKPLGVQVKEVPFVMLPAWFKA